MSDYDNRYHAVGHELDFIDELGSHSETGKAVGRRVCLEGYIKAMEQYGSPRRQWSEGQVYELIWHATMCLGE